MIQCLERGSESLVMLFLHTVFLNKSGGDDERVQSDSDLFGILSQAYVACLSFALFLGGPIL